MSPLTLVALIQEFITKEITFAKVSQNGAHFLPSSTNHITCNDKPQSRIPSASRSRQNVSCLPTFLLSNVRFLNAKIDELQVVAQQNHVDVIAITETWLNPEIPDGPVFLTDFSIVRKDRASGKRGEGICAFIKSGIPFSTLTDLCVPEIECVWLKLRPHRLPRELACILVGVIYHRLIILFYKTT